MFQNKSIYVRMFLTLVMCYLIYGETGPYTAIGFGLIAVSLEFVGWWIGQVNKLLEMMSEKLD